MLHYALVFLVVALIAGALGVSGVAAVATNIAYILFVVAIVLFVVHLLSGRRSLRALSLQDRRDTNRRAGPACFSSPSPAPSSRHFA